MGSLKGRGGTSLGTGLPSYRLSPPAPPTQPTCKVPSTPPPCAEQLTWQNSCRDHVGWHPISPPPPLKSGDSPPSLPLWKVSGTWRPVAFLPQPGICQCF